MRVRPPLDQSLRLALTIYIDHRPPNRRPDQCRGPGLFNLQSTPPTTKPAAGFTELGAKSGSQRP